MSMNSACAHVMLLLSVALCAPAREARAQGPAPSALLYRGATSFFVQPPPGWRLDSEAGKSDGVLAAVYRVGESWQSGTVVMYAHTLGLTAGTPAAFNAELRSAEEEWRRRNPDAEIATLAPVVSEDSSRAVVKRFASARNAQFELVAYFQQDSVAPIIVLSARTKADLDRAFPDFLRLVRSYGKGPAVKKQRPTGSRTW
jgi:hypothetical protein